jgi:homoserine dehydrogenase
MNKIILVGFGNVGRAFAKLMLDKRALLSERYGIEWKIVAIATGNHGTAFQPEGIDLDQAISLFESGGNLSSLSAMTPPHDVLSLIKQSEANVLFENTPVSYMDGQPAIGYLQAALQSGMHAITANKGPVVHAYEDLSAQAVANGVGFFFESTVMDGTPIFSLWRDCLPGTELLAFRGILNSTTNMMLTLMESGKSFDDALAYAQEIGVAETDPTGDIDGWDAAVKLAALVNVLMKTPLKPSDIDRQGIGDITIEKVELSTKRGLRWRLICEARIESGTVRGTVSPQEIGSHDPLYYVEGTSSSITFQTDVLGDLTIRGDNPGTMTTAYGLLADFIRAIRTPIDD